MRTNCSDQSEFFPIVPVTENQEKLFENININDSENGDCSIDDFQTLIPNEKIGVAFLAGQIEKRIQFDRLIKCELCHEAFSENDKLAINSFPASKQSQVPCQSTYYICALAHCALGSQMIKRDFSYNEVFNSILSEVCLNSIFPKTDFESHSTHKLLLVKYIVEKYITSRANYVARKLNLENERMLENANYMT